MFGAVKLTKNADISKYKCSGYGNGFDGKGAFSHPSGGFGSNAIIFGVDITSSAHDNKKKIFNSWWRTYTRIRYYYMNCGKLIELNSNSKFYLN